MILVGSLAIAVAEPTPDTLTALVRDDGAVVATFIVTMTGA
jgi:hypothetical protein